MKPEYLKYYVEAINKIDDYFEYRSDSLKDRNFVYGVLDRLSDNLKTLEEVNEHSQEIETEAK